MQSTPLIRPCEIDDLPAVQRLLEQLNEVAHIQSPLDAQHLRDLWREMSAAPEIYLNLVCEVQGQVAGFLSLIFYRTFFHHGGTALINELVVDAAWRGQGLGQALIAHAVSAARERGMDEVEVGTEHDNLPAQAFYQRAGFNESYLLLGMEFDEA